MIQTALRKPLLEVDDMSDIILFQFEQSQIRTITDEKGEPWFVARDIALALGCGRNHQGLEAVTII